MSWIPAVASVASSVMSMFGQEDTNDANRDIQNQNNAFNAEQAALNRTFQDEQADQQMAFQERMANSTWQRGIKDMRAAGLNPMLAYSQGGNPAPAGAAGHGSAASAGPGGNQVNPYAAAGGSAMQWAQIENIQAQTDRTKAEEELIRDQATTEKGRPAQVAAETDRIRKHAELYLRQHGLTNAQTDKVAAEIQTELRRPRNVDADTALKAVNEILQKHDIPRMRAEDLYFRSPVGRESPHNKYGPQTPFRFLEGLGERVINRWGASDKLPTPGGKSTPGNYVPYR